MSHRTPLARLLTLARPLTLAGVAALAAGVSLAPRAAHAQIQASPEASISTVIDGTTLEVEYHRPSARGRTLFGDLVPWGEVWTPGANWASVLRVDRDIRMNGVEVPAGEYAMWMIPDPEEFTLMLDDAEVRAFHAVKPSPDAIALHVPAAPQGAAHTEMLTWRIPSQRGDGARLEFAWGETAVPFEVVVQPSEPVTLERWERDMYTGTWTMTFPEFAQEGFGLPPSADLEIWSEEGRLRGRLPFPLHADDELAWDLVPAGPGGAFNPGLYRGETLFTIEMGVNIDFDLHPTEDRATAVRFSTPDGMVWAEGEPAG